MAPSTTSGSPKRREDAVKDLESSIAGIKQQPVTIGGKKMFAVSSHGLSSLERRVDRLLEHAGLEGGDPEKAMELHDTVASLRSENDKLRALQAGLEAEEQKLKAHIRELQSDVKDSQANLDTCKASTKELVSSLKRQLATAQDDSNKAKLALSSADAKFDPDAAVALNEAAKLAKAEVKSIQDKLASAHDKLAKASKEAHAQQAEYNRVQAELSALKGQNSQLKNAMVMADEKREVMTLNPAVEKLLGEKACEVLLKWNQVALADVKERSYVAMSALKGHRNKFLASLGKLFEAAWKWCKEQTLAARKALRPWLDMVHADLMAAKLQTIRFYRDELDAIIKIVDKKKAEFTEATGKEEPSWFSDLWFYGYAIALRIRRRSQRPVGRVLSACVAAGYLLAATGVNLVDAAFTFVKSPWHLYKGRYWRESSDFTLRAIKRGEAAAESADSFCQKWLRAWLYKKGPPPEKASEKTQIFPEEQAPEITSLE